MHKNIKLFAKREKIYQQRIWGKYRKIKWIAMIALLGIYYLAPWLRWDRGPLVPDQAILIDMPNRRAYFFFIEIWPQEVYYLAAILIFSAIALFFITSLFGRVWCGYACPQTVWTDLFIWVERIFQGRRNDRIKLDNAPLSWQKIWRKTATHLTWLLISVATAGAWVFYFNDAPTLFYDIIHFDISWNVLSWIIALTFSTYLMAGLAREQVCTYVCPYSRFQSAMFDKDSLIIGYDEKRGEPRGKLKEKGKGDCVDCGKCVIVCPQGIDIRNGLQMECIACGLCIDACNSVMDKISKPRGLIRYDTTRNMSYRAQGKDVPPRILRPRTIYYSALLVIVGIVIIFNLLNRSVLELHVIPDRNPLFVQLSDGQIRNGYVIKILNKTHDDKIFSLNISGIENTKLVIQNALDLKANYLPVYADSVGQFRVFVSSPKQEKARTKVTFTITDKSDSNTAIYEGTFISAN